MEMKLWRELTDNERNIRLEWKRAHYDQTVTCAYATTWEEAEFSSAEM